MSPVQTSRYGPTILSISYDMTAQKYYVAWLRMNMKHSRLLLKLNTACEAHQPAALPVQQTAASGTLSSLKAPFSCMLYV